MRASLIILSLGLAATACTQRSETIGAMAVSPQPFMAQSCESLDRDYADETAKLKQLSLLQDDAIVADVRVLGASLGSVPQTGSVDKSAAIAYTKGRVNAMDVAMRQKDCPQIR